jgi:hypothetical protein
MERIKTVRGRTVYVEDCIIIELVGRNANISHPRIDPLDGRASQKPSTKSIRS